MTLDRELKTLGHELRALDAMDNLGLWMTPYNLGHKLKALDATNNLGLWIIWMTQDPMSSGH